MTRRAASYTLIALTFALPLAGQPAPQNQAAADAVKAKYEKREIRITMRDGVKLFTSVYAPRDTSRRYPILMPRTPYGLSS